MRDYGQFSINMKAEFAEAKTVDEKQQIVDDFVKKLRSYGLSDDKITEIGNIELIIEAQGNRVMISNDQKYKIALAKALGRK